MDAHELELPLGLDGAAYEMAPGVIAEFMVRRTKVTPQRPTASAMRWCCDRMQVVHLGSGSTTRMRSSKEAGAVASDLPMTIGTERLRTRAARTRSQQR